MIITLLVSCGVALGSLSEVSSTLNSTIQKAEVKNDLRKILPDLARTLDVKSEVLEKAMLNEKLKLSDVAMAKFISDKTAESIDTYLTSANALDWDSALKKAGVKESEAEEYLDNMQTEVALVMMDYHQGRR